MLTWRPARNLLRMLIWQITVSDIRCIRHAECADIASAELTLFQDRQTQKFKEIRDRFFSMPPTEGLPRSQLAQAQPPQPSAIGHASEHKDRTSASASPGDHMESGLAALQQGSYSAMSNDNPSEDADARNKSKRELSTSKRAAQNRAAQVRVHYLLPWPLPAVYTDPQIARFSSKEGTIHHRARGESQTIRDDGNRLSQPAR